MVYNSMHIYIKPSKIHVVLINEKIAIQHAWLILHSGLPEHVMEGEIRRKRNLQLVPVKILLVYPPLGAINVWY